jgi:hypothetical protein
VTCALACEGPPPSGAPIMAPCTTPAGCTIPHAGLWCGGLLLFASTVLVLFECVMRWSPFRVGVSRVRAAPLTSRIIQHHLQSFQAELLQV